MRRIFTLIISATLLVFQAKAQLGVFVESVGTGTSPSVNTYTGWTSGLPSANFTGTAGVSIVAPDATNTASINGGSMVRMFATGQNEQQTFTISNIPVANFPVIAISFNIRRVGNNSTTFVEYSLNGTTWTAFTFLPAIPADAFNWQPQTSATVTLPLGTTSLSIRFRTQNTNAANDRTTYIDGIVVGPLALLPLTTRNFTAVPRNGRVNLSWTGVATHMNSKFEVERSSKGNSGFTAISTIPTRIIGESTYSFTDESPLLPASHYRIRITDENGRVSYTKVLKVAIRGAHFALDNLFPSVANAQVNLVVSSSSSKPIEVFVFDSYGRMVIQKKIVVATGSQSYPLDITRLNSGSYTVRLSQENEIITGKFIKQ
ncbi:T9SS type A sorting domain-containing protein [Flavihumibacter sediminis]|nr:T9SS type A sorting domain-containing protein [Flavihumibacter sediminis]